MSTGHLVYILGGAIVAVPFDVDTLKVTGGPVPLVEDVAEAGAQIQGGAGQFTLTSDGTLAYVPGNIALTGAQRTLVWVDRQGREEPIPAPPGGYLYPRISPDGTRLALDVQGQNRDIWVWDFGRRTLTRLTFDPTADRSPIWTPDGRRLIFASMRAAGGNLFWQAADGTGEAERLTESLNLQFATGISPDGTQVIFRESSDLMVLTVPSPRKVQPLLTSMFAEGNGEVSPDGRWLAYQSTASNREVIFVVFAAKTSL